MSAKATILDCTTNNSNDGLPRQAKMLDENRNGKIDKIQLEICNFSGATWGIYNNPNLTVTYGNGPNNNSVTIISKVFSAPNSNPAVLDISLKESDLGIDTSGISANGALGDLEVIYVQDPACDPANIDPANRGNCIASSASLQLVAIASGDTSPNVEETDYAEPVFVKASTVDANNNATIEGLSLLFSEKVKISDGNAGDGFPVLSLTSSNVTVTIDNKDYAIGNSSTDTLLLDITPSVTNDTSLVITPKYTSGNATYNIKDISTQANEMKNNATVAGTDGAEPVLLSVDFGTNTTITGGTINQIKLTYSEDMKVSSDGGTTFLSLGSSIPSSANLGDTTTVKTLSGFGTWAEPSGSNNNIAGDMVTSSATGNLIIYGTNKKEVIVLLNANGASPYFKTGTKPPTTPVFTTTASNIKYLSDLASSPNATAAGVSVNATNSSAWDVTPPTVTNIYSCDPDQDGDINQMQLNFNEWVIDASFNPANFEGDNDATNDNVGEETPSSVNTATGGCDGNADDTDADDDKIRFDFTNGIAGTDVAYFRQITAGARDHAGNRLQNSAVTSAPRVDKAKPVLMSVDFIQDSIGINANKWYNLIRLRYSEAMQLAPDGVNTITAGQITSSTATLGSTTNVNKVTGFGIWTASNGGDMVTSSDTGNSIAILAPTGDQVIITLNSDANSYFSSGTSAPTTPVFTTESIGANYLSDLTGLAVVPNKQVTATFPSTPWDVTPPTATNVYSCDTDLDGDIDRIQLTFSASETLLDSSFNVANFEADNDNTNDGTGEETPASFNTATGGCDGNADDTDANDNKIRFDLNTGISGTDVAYFRQVTVGARDVAGNRMQTVGGTLVDKAKPLIIAETPQHNSVDQPQTLSPQITWSEAMDTNNFNVGISPTGEPSGGSVTSTWTNGNTVVTLSPAGVWNLGKNISLTLNAQDPGGNTNGGVANGIANIGHPYQFTIIARTASSGSNVKLPSGTIKINNGASSTSSNNVTLNLTSSDASAEMVIGNDPNFIGQTWQPFSSTKTWTLASGLGDKTVYFRLKNKKGLSQIYQATIKVVQASSGSSGASNSSSTNEANQKTQGKVGVLSLEKSSIDSDKLSLPANNTDFAVITVLVKDGQGNPLKNKKVVLKTSRSLEDTITILNSTTDDAGKAKFKIKSSNPGISTLIAIVDDVALTKTLYLQFTSVDKNTEQIQKEKLVKSKLVPLSISDLIKSKDNPAIYYYGADGKRHAFTSELIYKSYYSDFSKVKEVPKEQLAGLPLGSNVRLRPGTWLVKIESDPKVYAVEPGGKLRWIKKKKIAKALYGSNWNKKIIDISVALFNNYTVAEPKKKKKHPTSALIKYKGSSDIYFINNGKKSKFKDLNAFKMNLFQQRFVQEISSDIQYADGPEITGKDDSLVKVVY